MIVKHILRQLNLLSLLRSSGASFILVLTVSVLADISSIALLGLSAWLIATAALMPPLYVLSLAIVGVRCCGIMRSVFRYLERYLLHQTGFSLFTRFRVFMLYQITQSLPFKQHSSLGNIFDIIVNAVDSLRDNFLRFSLPPLTATIITILAMLWLSSYSILLVILLGISWLLFAGLLPLLSLNYYRKIQPAATSLIQDIMDIYSGNLELHAYNYHQAKLAHTDKSIEQYQQYNQHLFQLKSKLTLYSEICVGVFITVLFIILIHLVNNNALNHNFTAVTAITILLTLQALWENLSLLPSLSHQLSEARQNLAVLMPFICNSAATVPPLPTVPANEHLVDSSANTVADKNAILTITNLSFGYQHNTPLMHDLNFKLYPGEKTLLIGESGCGKSTLFYVLTKILPPLAGNIILKGQSYTDLTRENIAENFAVSFQEHHLFNLSIKENFQMLYPSITDTQIKAALDSVDLTSLYTERGLDYVLEQNGANLSGGQKHRLQLAICLAKKKPLVLLDEPTAGLDITAANSFLTKLWHTYRQQTILVASHDLSLLHYFDNIIIMANRTIVEQGKINHLLCDRNSFLFKLINYHNFI